MFLKLLYHKIGEINLINMELILVSYLELENMEYCMIKLHKMLIEKLLCHRKEIQVKFGDEIHISIII